jgi:hypothetical protein
MDQAKDIDSADIPKPDAIEAPKLTITAIETPKIEPPSISAIDTPKPTIVAIDPPKPTISAIETPAIELPKASATSVEPDSASDLLGARRNFIQPPRIGRFAQLAAAMTLAAGFGAFAGAFGASSFHTPAPPPVVAVAAPADSKDVVARLSAELSTLRSGIESTTRNANAQFAKLAERFDRAEKAQAEPAAKLARIGETLERLERRPPAPIAAAPATTAAAASPTTSASGAQAPETTGSIVEKQQATVKPLMPPVVEGWILRDVYDGLALVESRRGLIEVGPGSNIPGVGRVETIRKQDGRWIVVTPKGVIVSAR